MTVQVPKNPTGDPELARIMADLWTRGVLKAPFEDIVGTDFVATGFNRAKLGSNILNRIVDLACGHKAVTTNKRRAPCDVCLLMLLNGEDYDAFRNRKG